MFARTKDLLLHAHAHGYAVGAFNVNNLEIAQAIVIAAEQQRSPVILATSEGAIEYAGIAPLYGMMRALADQATVPIGIHLDHGKSFEMARNAVRSGYSSVMIDGSHLPLEENVHLTKKVVAFAHRHHVGVEGELGTIGGSEDLVHAREIVLTDPVAAKYFVRETRVDSLAVAIGTSHGAFKFAGKPKLDIKRLAEISSAVPVPLVLHGSSMLPKKLLDRARKAGLHIHGALGVPAKQVQDAIAFGVAKVNTDTDLRIAFATGEREALKRKEEFDPRKLLAPARALMKDVVVEHMNVFGSSNQVR